jgi:hypothetical protein
MGKPFGVLWQALWALSGAESTSMTRRIHAFRGAFRGTVFNPDGQARGFPCSGKHG